ncbi:hypothetical protein GALMADRAFT_276610 [Galerina marginata CBS 339.88]|uniref:Uncharacterized protein n=1 Tax=Galerina marginata (strain CBS 339.88) TaxID=685588 RepID=A0A067TQ17_GALM3|nr:hypothetical protein GALMADRAFT_276610 [Galerina marginata CBS 339.88]
MSEHEHHHRHGEEHSHDYATANKEHFHKAASNEENVGKVDVAKRCARAILERYPFDENSTTVMDFACNTGVDITQAPVDIFNEHVSNQGIPLEKLRAVCVELKGEEGELDGLKFDVITCAAAYHHFPDIDKITKTLAFFLKSGGFLFVVDIAPKETSSSSGTSGITLFPEQYQHVVAHRDGLTQEALKGAFDDAGLVSFTFEPFSTVTVHEKEGILFVAKGTKPTN